MKLRFALAAMLLACDSPIRATTVAAGGLIVVKRFHYGR